MRSFGYCLRPGEAQNAIIWLLFAAQRAVNGSIILHSMGLIILDYVRYCNLMNRKKYNFIQI